MYPPALVLNADYRPISYHPLSTLGWEEAIHAVFKGRVDVVDYYDIEIHSPSTTMLLPSVVALREYKTVKKHAAFTRFNVFLRDGFKCQYCGNQYRAEDLTFDHVNPRCLGGTSRWDNVVAACRPCNGLKGHRTDMRPIRDPIKPSIYQLQDQGRKFPPKYLHDSWRDYLYWDSALEEV